MPPPPPMIRTPRHAPARTSRTPLFDAPLPDFAVAGAGDKYSQIRIFTVGQGTTSAVPLTQLGSIVQTWTTATGPTVGLAEWTSFSATCWFFGRDIYDALNGTVPMGWVAPRRAARSESGGGAIFSTLPLPPPPPSSFSLISNNWGGTVIESWSPPAALKACNKTVDGATVPAELPPVARVDGVAPFNASAGPDPNGNHVLWDSMIVPYITGPMAVKGFTWVSGIELLAATPGPVNPVCSPSPSNSAQFQGESNAQEPDYYACAFPVMISAWRAAFNNPEGWFG